MGHTAYGAGSPGGSRRSRRLSTPKLSSGHSQSAFGAIPLSECTKTAVFLSDSQASARNPFDNRDATCDIKHLLRQAYIHIN